MLFLADIKTAFINSSSSSVISQCFIKRTEQASGVVQLMPEGPLRHLKLSLFNNAKFVPRYLHQHPIEWIREALRISQQQSQEQLKMLTTLAEVRLLKSLCAIPIHYRF